MNKIIKIALTVSVIVFAGFVIIAGLVMTLFDPNTYKETIASTIKKQTGRELVIQGDINLSLFPWIGAELGQISLGNADLFGPEPFAQIQGADIHVKVWPLLSKEIVVDTITLHGLHVNLERNATGVTNWQDLVADKPGSAPDAPAPKASGRNARAIAALAIAGLELEDTHITWKDRMQNTYYKVSDFTLSSDAIVAGQPFDIDLAFEFDSQNPAIAGQVTLVSTVMIDINAQRYNATHLKLATLVKGNMIPGNEQSATIMADIESNLGTQTVEVDNLSIQAAGSELTGSISATNIASDPLVKGKLNTGTLNPRSVLTQLAIAVPDTSDRDVLTKATAKIEFDASGNHININKLISTIDDSTLTGNITVMDFGEPNINFLANIDQIDLDLYMPPTEQERATATPAAAATAGALELPLDMLRSMQLKGTSTIGKLKFSNLQTSDIKLTIDAKNGLIKIHPASAQLYDGQYSGHIQLDASGNVPAFSFNEKLSNIQAGPFLKDLMNTDFFSGTTNANVKLATRGATVDDLRKSLNGNLSFSFSDGRVHGLNLANSIKEDYGQLTKKLVKDLDSLDQTVFSSLAGNAQIKNGLVSTDNLVLKSAQMDINGKGSADLVTEKLDLRLDISAKKELEKQLAKLDNYLVEHPIPYYIKGTFSNPRTRSGLSDMLKAKAKLEVDRAVNREKKKLEKKILEKNAPSSVKEDAAVSPEEKIKKKLKNELDKQLNKLFRF
ncbi:MAG: AsmA-like C-terminal domain-containing protein [Gammaproteobacteria bacterium]